MDFSNYKRDKGSINFGEIPKNGVVFLFSIWSESRLYLSHLINTLNDYPNLPLYIIDIDDPLYQVFKDQYDFLSQGKGEVLFIKNGILENIIKDYKSEKNSIRSFLDSAN
ncbi:MAG: hypothetical protein QM534_10350 [Sediminibacterium sp.]|nr:hypothetical protein [Sediminibacterium sp.]